MATELNHAPLVSVLIPTRNRAHTAIETIRAALAIPSPSLEVIVQDCGTDDRLEQMLAEVDDPRLHYARTGPTSMSGNWENALARATGEYVIVIGDDDAVNPEVVAIAEWAREQDLDAVSGERAAVYYWPGVARRDLEATLFVNTFSGEARFPDAGTELLRSSFGYGNRLSNLPMVYHGLVRRSLLEELHRTTGRYVDSTAPDLYSGHALATLLRRYAMVSYPLTIAGISPSSNSGKSTGGQHAVPLAENEHAREYGQLEWPELLPPLMVVATIEAEAMLRAWRRTGNEQLVRNINLPFLYATVLTETRGRFLRVALANFVRANRVLGRAQLPAFARLAGYLGARAAQQLVLRSFRPLGAGAGIAVLRQIDNVHQAVCALSATLQEAGRGFRSEAQLNRVQRFRAYLFNFR